MKTNRDIIKGWWGASMASRLGLGGGVEHTITREGQTLHLPCSHGHVVDIPLGRQPQHPDAVAKKLIYAGWTLGGKLKCPEHSRREKREAKAIPVGTNMEEWAKTTPLEERLAIHGSGGKKRWAGIPPEERKRMMAELRLKKEEKKVQSQTMNTPAISASAVKSDDMTPDARKAHRLVMQALEDYYDESAKRYRAGYSDKRIAEELGVSEKSVAKAREDFFGPLAPTMPDEMLILAKQMAAFREEAASIAGRLASAVGEMEASFAALCDKNGWAIGK